MNRMPTHIGIIPDGNRRWAAGRGLPKEAGYEAGLAPGLEAFRLCRAAGVKELTFYGFTQDNTKRQRAQTQAFQAACVAAVRLLADEDAGLLVVGNSDSPMFPRELLPFTRRRTFGAGGMKLNFLVNYGWQWDLSPALAPPLAATTGGPLPAAHALAAGARGLAPSLSPMSNGVHTEPLPHRLRSAEISRLDLIIRWGGRRRLSGFLPLQSVYADFYVVESLWPDFQPAHLTEALAWYQTQDITLGG